MKRFVRCLAGFWLGCLRRRARPSEKMELPDWSKTPVEDRDLGGGVHMLESFGGNIGVLAGDEGVLLVDAEWPQLHDKVVGGGGADLAAAGPLPGRTLTGIGITSAGDGLFGKAGVVIFSSEQTREYIERRRPRKPHPPGTPYAPDPAAIPVVTVTTA